MTEQIVGYLVYSTQQGDSFDSMALMAYNDEFQAHQIIRANPDYADILIFNAGVALSIPRIYNLVTPDSLAPWRR